MDFDLIYHINNSFRITMFKTNTGYGCQKLDSQGRETHSDNLIRFQKQISR